MAYIILKHNDVDRQGLEAELRNAIERAVILTEAGRTVSASALGLPLAAPIGSGLGIQELCALTEELGASLVPEPLIAANGFSCIRHRKPCFDATRFIVTDVRAEASVTGRAQRTTTRSFGAGPRDERWVHLVRALVPAGWQRTQPVPAWIACTTSPGFDCLSGLDAKGIVRIRRDEIDHFRPAIADAERRHRVVSAADAPIVEASSDPAAAPWIYLAAVASIQITCFEIGRAHV